MYPGEIYGQLACAYINLNQFDKAEAVLSEAKAHKAEYLYFPGIRYQLAFFRSNEGEMEKQVAETTGKPAIESWVLALQADTEAYRGHLVKARESTGRAIKSARHDGMEEGALAYAAVGALREAQFGNHAAALRLINTSLAHNYGQEVEIFRGLAYAQAGDGNKALTVVRDLNQRFPLDTLINEYWLPTIRAAVELHRNDPTQAIEDLEQTKRYELASPQTVTTELLYPVYLRGEAYLAAGLPDKALAEFQKILDHPGLVGNYVLGVLTHLDIGRAYAMEAGIPVVSVHSKSGSQPHVSRDLDRSDALAKARSAYQDFFSLWRDADAGIPILTRAQQEYRKLE
jgi:tetratricopeptide (TPR) repeat protein